MTQEGLVGATEFVRERLPDGYREGMRICSAVALLSLDISSGFLSVMGLADVDGDAVQAAARRTTMAHRARPDDQQHRPLPDVRERFLAAVEEGADAARAAQVARWLDGYFVRHLEDHRPWHDWRISLQHAVCAPEAVQPPAEGISRETMTQLAGLFDTSDIDAGIDALKELPISDWDLEMFIRRRQNPLDATTDPYFPISFQAESHRFMSGFPKLVQTLSADERTGIETMAARSQVHMKLPIRLVPLTELVGGPAA